MLLVTKVKIIKYVNVKINVKIIKYVNVKFNLKIKNFLKLEIHYFCKKVIFMKIIIINGPNLNLLGTREPDVYGNQTFENYFKELQVKFTTIDLHYYQSNVEGELINKIHEVGFNFDGIILNAGGYTHTSVAIADSVKSVSTPVVEVHISNTFSRESFRHQSYISPNAKGVIIGFGMQSYDLGICSFI